MIFPMHMQPPKRNARSHVPHANVVHHNVDPKDFAAAKAPSRAQSVQIALLSCPTIAGRQSSMAMISMRNVAILPPTTRG